MIALKYIMYKPRVTIDDEGIKLRGPEDGLFSNYSFDRIRSINLIYSEYGYSALSWDFKGKSFIRGIPSGVDLNKLQTIIEWNSNLKLIKKQS